MNTKQVADWLREAALTERSVAVACAAGILPERFMQEAITHAEEFDRRAAQVEAMTCDGCRWSQDTVGFVPIGKECLRPINFSKDDRSRVNECGPKFGCIHWEEKK